MWNNYYSLIDGIKEVSLHHTEEFYEGDVYEFLNNGSHKYPSTILTVQSVDTTDSINTVSATLFCVDRLTDNSDNKLEVQSLCMTKLLKILNSLEENVHNVVSNTFTPFTEKFSDLCGGMYVEFTLQYVGENLCDFEVEIKEIELTQNGIYDVIGYDRAIVNVRPEVNLEDMTITDNGEYTCGEGFDGLGKVNVDVQPPKVKVTTFKITNDCLNEDGIWEGDKLIDTSECTTIRGLIMDLTKMVALDTTSWDSTKFTSIFQFLNGCTKCKAINLINWNVPNLTQTNYATYRASALETLIWYKSIEEVLENNISCLNGLAVGLDVSTTVLDRASLRALINGLADLSDTTTQTLTLGATLRAKLTEEDIAIATNKNWTIA